MSQDKKILPDVYPIEKLRVSTNHGVKLLDATVSSSPMGEVLDFMMLQLEGYVMGGCPRKVAVAVDVPATWVGVLKRDVFSRWAANPATRIGRAIHRWTLRWETKTLMATSVVSSVICPHGTFDTPDHKSFLMGEDHG